MASPVKDESSTSDYYSSSDPSYSSPSPSSPSQKSPTSFISSKSPGSPNSKKYKVKIPFIPSTIEGKGQSEHIVRLDTPTPSNMDDGLADLSILNLSSTKDETQSKVADCPDTQDTSSTKNDSHVEIADLSVAGPSQIDDMKESQNDNNTPFYTRRLIPRIYAGASDIDEHFDEQKWYKKVYGPDIIVASTVGVPDGWILVDGIHCLLNQANNRSHPTSREN